MKHLLKKPDGTEALLTRDQLIISWNSREIDNSALAKPEGGGEWVRVGVLLGVGSAPAPEPASTPPFQTACFTGWGRDSARRAPRRMADGYAPP